jgi:hypothetical protein
MKKTHVRPSEATWFSTGAVRRGCLAVLCQLIIAIGLVSCHSTPSTIITYENIIRYRSDKIDVDKTRETILRNAATGHPWDEINRWISKFDDIDGARYDDENDRLVIWGLEAKDNHSKPLPPLLLDDFVVPLEIAEAGQYLGVSIGTISGRIPTESDIEHIMRTERLPVEYIPESTFGTHVGSVLYEVDRWLKALAHGEDNLTGEPISCSVETYIPVARRLGEDTTWESDKPRPLGLWFFIPDEPGIAFEGYTIKFVSYQMRVEYKSLVDDPAVEAFGKDLNEHFDEYAKEIPAFRELVRLHKLAQIARWYKESGFPTEGFLQGYKRLKIDTPRTTRMIRTLANTKTVPGPDPGSYYLHKLFLIGGVDLSPRNYYLPVSALPTPNVVVGAATSRPREKYSTHIQWSAPRYGSFRASQVPVPSFVKPIFSSRPSAASYGWAANVRGRRCIAVAIPMMTSSHS